MTVIETNPGHCAGWALASAFAGAHGAFLCELAGLLPPSPDRRRAASIASGHDVAHEGILFGYFDQGTGAD